jgi:hypothetical protein
MTLLLEPFKLVPNTGLQRFPTETPASSTLVDADRLSVSGLPFQPPKALPVQEA